MKLFCTAIVSEPQQMDNLCQCVKIIGATPDVHGDTVYVDFAGERETGQKLIDLFQQYPLHGISIVG